MARQKKNPPTPNQAPPESPASGPSSNADSPLSLDLNQVPANDGPDATAPAPDAEGRTSCQYCGKPFKNVARHELGCKKNPAMSLTGEPVAAESGLTVEALAKTFTGTFDIIAVSQGEKWKLSSIESSLLAEIWKPVFDAFMPNIMASKWTNLGIAALSTYALLAPRFKKDEPKQIAEPEKAA